MFVIMFISLIFSGVIFLSFYLFSYFFFNYPTLDDVARAFSFIHSYIKKDIYIYQLDVSYHGALLNGIIYSIFFSLFGISILSWRIANSFMISVGAFLALKELKKNQQKLIFSVLIVLSDIFFRRNVLLGGDYALIPLLVFTSVLLPGFWGGFAVGIGISTNPIFIFLLPYLLYKKNNKKNMFIGLCVGLIPFFIFNFWNFFLNLKSYSQIILSPADYFPTFSDIMIRYKEVLFKTDGININLNSLILLLFFVLSIFMLRYSRFFDFGFAFSFTVYFLISLIEERFSLFFRALSFIVIAEAFPYCKVEKNAQIINKISLILFFSSIILSVSSLFFLSSDRGFCKSYFSYPYSPKHCVKFDYEFIEKDVLCLKNFFEEKKLDYKDFGADVMAMGVIKFFNPSADIYYYYNPWSYFVPREFDGERKLKFIIEYYPLRDSVPKEEEYFGFLKRSMNICNFKVTAIRDMTRVEIQKTLFNKAYLRETGIKEIFRHILVLIFRISEGDK